MNGLTESRSYSVSGELGPGPARSVTGVATGFPNVGSMKASGGVMGDICDLISSGGGPSAPAVDGADDVEEAELPVLTSERPHDSSSVHRAEGELTNTSFVAELGRAGPALCLLVQNLAEALVVDTGESSSEAKGVRPGM